jgi:hypothetical protein
MLHMCHSLLSHELLFLFQSINPTIHKQQTTNDTRRVSIIKCSLLLQPWLQCLLLLFLFLYYFLLLFPPFPILNDILSVHPIPIHDRRHSPIRPIPLSVPISLIIISL